MRLGVLTLFFVVLFGYSQIPVHALGIGQCHALTELDGPLVSWGYESGNYRWDVIEPRRGEFNFAPFDADISRARSLGKKIWLQVLTNNPDNPTDSFIPDWAKDQGMGYDRYDTPLVWDHQYQEFMAELLTAMANRYDRPEYQDAIEAVVIMAGGLYGEMSYRPRYCYGQAGRVADVEDPNNFYLRQMALTFLGAEARAAELAVVTDNGLVFDTYLIQAMQRTVDLYAQKISHFPLVLLVGYGLSCQARVRDEVAAYAVNRYGSRIWLKYNGWGSFTGDLLATSEIYRFLGSYRSRARTVLEVGHPNFWCSREGCQWSTAALAAQHNLNHVLAAANKAGASSVCFQGVFFPEPEKYPVNYRLLQERLVENAASGLTGPSCLNYRQGNLDCDSVGRIDETDLFILLFNWSTRPVESGAIGDIVVDNRVDEKDLARLLQNWQAR